MLRIICCQQSNILKIATILLIVNFTMVFVFIDFTIELKIAYLSLTVIYYYFTLPIRQVTNIVADLNIPSKEYWLVRYNNDNYVKGYLCAGYTSKYFVVVTLKKHKKYQVVIFRDMVPVEIFYQIKLNIEMID